MVHRRSRELAGQDRNYPNWWQLVHLEYQWLYRLVLLWGLPIGLALRPLNHALHDHRDPLATAYAQRRQAALGIAALHLVQQRHQDARAASADRVTQRDRASIYVDAVPVPA